MAGRKPAPGGLAGKALPRNAHGSSQDDMHKTAREQSVQHPIPAPPDQRTVQGQPGWPGPSEGGPRPYAAPPSAASSGAFLLSSAVLATAASFFASALSTAEQDNSKQEMT
ncbi:MAG: hypothetical protein FRX49_07779 [Trebouxia sp. A1-2]|nr:MAG: hypothetical protein FRX49_07779 [Trebouxia sp. A1-2]